MKEIELVRQAISEKGRVVFSFTGKSMYPTLKETMKLTIVSVSPKKIRNCDIIAYEENNIIVAHRVIDTIKKDGEFTFITKGDNQPFGGVSWVDEKALLGKIETAFYENSSEKNILNNNFLVRLFYLSFGWLYLFYRKSVRRYLPKFLRVFLKNIVAGIYL